MMGKIDFKHNDEKNLALFFIDNSKIIHPEILSVVSPILRKYSTLINAANLFLSKLEEAELEHNSTLVVNAKDIWSSRLNRAGLEYTGNDKLETSMDIGKLVGVTIEGHELYGLSFNKMIFQLLLADYLDGNREETFSDEHKWWDNAGIYDFILSIQDVNDALAQGIDAWEDAIYLYRYNIIKDWQGKLAKSPTSALVRMTGFGDGEMSTWNAAVIVETLFEEEGMGPYDNGQRRFNSRLDAIAYVRRLDNILRRLKIKAEQLKGKYNKLQDVN